MSTGRTTTTVPIYEGFGIGERIKPTGRTLEFSDRLIVGSLHKVIAHHQKADAYALPGREGEYVLASDIPAVHLFP